MKWNEFCKVTDVQSFNVRFYCHLTTKAELTNILPLRVTWSNINANLKQYRRSTLDSFTSNLLGDSLLL